jgi:UDP-3-O-acyl N-acetylglucosamine deacetylase
METARKQRTIASSVAVEGFGYWSGEDVRLEFRPAEANSGIVFVRGDLAGQPRVRACVENRVETPRRTSLRKGAARVEMIEHVMAALAGLEIDNCEVWADRPEMPGCDGSSQPFLAALDQAGIVVQDAPRRRVVVRQAIRLGNQDAWVEAWPTSGDRPWLTYRLDYGPGPIGRQTFDLEITPDSFRRELAACRTFMLKAEADWLQAKGLGLRATYRDLLVFSDKGPIDNQLRFDNECVRHKLMDMVGDLGLAGCDLVGRFVAYRSGHRLNAELVGSLMAQANHGHVWRRCA